MPVLLWSSHGGMHSLILLPSKPCPWNSVKWTCIYMPSLSSEHWLKFIWILLTETRIEFLNALFHASSGSYSHRMYIKIGHWSPGICISLLLNAVLILKLQQAMCEVTINSQVVITYSGLLQSKPAGQRRKLVHSWLNPRSILTFHTIGGVRDCPGGIIQSRIAPFRPLVSLARALDKPFWSLKCGE